MPRKKKPPKGATRNAKRKVGSKSTGAKRSSKATPPRNRTERPLKSPDSRGHRHADSKSERAFGDSKPTAESPTYESSNRWRKYICGAGLVLGLGAFSSAFWTSIGEWTSQNFLSDLEFSRDVRDLRRSIDNKTSSRTFDLLVIDVQKRPTERQSSPIKEQTQLLVEQLNEGFRDSRVHVFHRVISPPAREDAVTQLADDLLAGPEPLDGVLIDTHTMTCGLRHRLAFDDQSSSKSTRAPFLLQSSDETVVCNLLDNSISSSGDYSEVIDSINVLYGTWLIDEMGEVEIGLAQLTLERRTGRESRLAAAQYLASKGRWTECARIVELIRESHPHDSRALVLAAQVALHGGRWHRAENFARSAISEAPESMAATLALALSQLFQGRYSESLEAFELVPETQLFAPHVAHYYFETLARLGRFNEITKIESRIDNPPSFLLTLQAANLELSNPALAARMYRQTLRTDSDNAVAHIRLGGILIRQGKYGDGLNHIYEALASDCNRRQVTEALPDLLSDPQISIHWETWRNRSRQHSGYSEALILLMDAFRRVYRQDWQQIGLLAREAYTLREDLAPAYVLDAWANGMTPPNADDAHGPLPGRQYVANRKATQVAPDNSIALVAFGRSLALRREYVEAESCFRRAMTIDPFYPLSYWRLSQLILQRGDLSEHRLREAENHIQTALCHANGAIKEAGPVFLQYFYDTRRIISHKLGQCERAIEYANWVVNNATDPKLIASARDYTESRASEECAPFPG